MGLSKNIFIVFEGIDGSGKGTQIDLLARWFQGQKIPYFLSHEPQSNNPIGSLISEILRKPEILNIRDKEDFNECLSQRLTKAFSCSKSFLTLFKSSSV
jgi:dTMP kinase